MFASTTTKAGVAVVLSCLALAVAGCGGGGTSTADQAEEQAGSASAAAATKAPKRPEPTLRSPQGPPPKSLVVKDLIEGGGAAAERGDKLTVDYIGIHYDGKQFTNSWERGQPFKFTLGGGNLFVNPGWEKGLPGMRVGGRRELIVPPQLLYRGGAIPGSKPADSLVYVIDLEAVE
jgi:peptidylprolyl isomerase